MLCCLLPLRRPKYSSSIATIQFVFHILEGVFIFHISFANEFHPTSIHPSTKLIPQSQVFIMAFSFVIELAKRLPTAEFTTHRLRDQNHYHIIVTYIIDTQFTSPVSYEPQSQHNHRERRTVNPLWH